MFLSVAERFKALCAMMMPSMICSLVKVHECASKGLVINCSMQGAAIQTIPTSGSLEQLSGGQRTLASLALLLATAQHGNPSSILLLDEVDAALDERNQASFVNMSPHLVKFLFCSFQKHPPLSELCCDSTLSLSY